MEGRRTGHGPEPEDEETANPAGGRNVIPSNLAWKAASFARSSHGGRGRRDPAAQTVHRGHAAGDGAREPVRGGQNLKAALDDDESHSGGIGTPATRADTIEKLVRSKLVERKGRQLHATTGRTPHRRGGATTKDVLTARGTGVVRRGTARRDPADVMDDMFHREALRIPPTRPRTSRPMPSTTANTDAQEWGSCHCSR